MKESEIEKKESESPVSRHSAYLIPEGRAVQVGQWCRRRRDAADQIWKARVLAWGKIMSTRPDYYDRFRIMDLTFDCNWCL